MNVLLEYIAEHSQHLGRPGPYQPTLGYETVLNDVEIIIIIADLRLE